MNNKIAILALITASAALAAVIMKSPAPAGASGAQKEESVFQHVMQTHTLRCGYAMWNPVLFKDPKTGELKGIAYDLMEEVGKKLDLKIDWAEEVGWSTMIEGLTAHRYDAICQTLGVISARAKVIGFSTPIMYSPVYIVVRSDENRVTRNEDLNNANYTFSLLEGEAASFLIPQDFPQAKVDQLPRDIDFTFVMQDVIAKKSDAAAVTMPDFLEYDKANPGKLKILDKNPIGVYSLAFGLSQNDMAMKTMIDAALKEIYSDGTTSRIIQKYSLADGEFLKPAKPYEPFAAGQAP